MPKIKRSRQAALRSTMEGWAHEAERIAETFWIYEATDDPGRDQAAAKVTHCLTNGISSLMGHTLTKVGDEQRRAAAFRHWGNPEITLVRRMRQDCEAALQAAAEHLRDGSRRRTEQNIRERIRLANDQLGRALDLLTDDGYSAAVAATTEKAA